MKKAMFIPFLLGFIVACSSNVAALSAADAQRLLDLETLTSQQQNRLATIESQLATLQASVQTVTDRPQPAVFVQAPRAPGLSAARFRSANATSPDCTGLGTLTGRPDTSNPITSNLLAGVSCTGYLYVMTQAATDAEQAILQGIPVTSLRWTSDDCTGPAYVAPGQLSSGVFVSGAVFRRAGSPAAPTDPNDPASYWYIPAGAPRVTITPGSFIDAQPNSETCISLSVFNTPPQPIDNAVSVLPNDPAITGIPSAPIPGPISIGTSG